MREIRETEDSMCRRCGTMMSLEDREEPRHGLCWPCSSVYAEELEDALRRVLELSTSGSREQIRIVAECALAPFGNRKETV